MSYPVFIVCRDRITSLLALIDWLERAGHADEIYLIDNDSTWPVLLDYYETTRHTVIRTGSNGGHRVGWEAGILRRVAGKRRFVYTDPDVVPTEDCPLDALEQMAAVLDRDSQAVKCGFGIKIDDIAEWCKPGITDWENKFWQRWNHRIGAFVAPIDTTFALHNPRGVNRFLYKPAYRLPAPYLIRHVPWYVDPANLSDEDTHYIANADKTISNWARYVPT